MKRSVFNGSFLVVEGVTDARLYGKFTDADECYVIPAHSKDNVRLSVTEMFKRRNDKKVAGIIDSDTDRLRDVSYGPPLFVTDSRDADTVLIKSKALDNVLTEYGDRDKIKRFVERYGTIRDSVVASCYPLGLLMYMSEMNDHSLSFRDLDHDLFINKKNLRTDLKEMADTVIKNSQRPDIDADTLLSKLAKELKNEHDPWDVCRGHDMISVLAIGLRNIFGSYNCRYIKNGELAGALRLAYDETTFKDSNLYKCSNEWFTRNKMKVWS
jgi:hypothetical protein